jgi:hypothetical protein
LIIYIVGNVSDRGPALPTVEITCALADQVTICTAENGARVRV